MLTLLACVSPAQAGLTNHTYWAYLPAPPPLLQVIEWTEKGPNVSTNDSTLMPPPWNLEGPSHAVEEGKLINISLGYEVLPLCPGPRGIMHKRQSTNLGFRPASIRRLLDIAWITYCPFFVCEPCLYY